jgi:soluble lytic murein transglycosylase-like protein
LSALVIAAMLAVTAPRLAAQSDLGTLLPQIQQSQCREGLTELALLASASTDLDAQRANFLYGWCLARLGRHADAISAFQAASPHPALGGYARVEEIAARVKTGDATGATPALRQMAPNAPPALRRRIFGALGEAELAAGRPDRALYAFALAAAARPDDPIAWLRLGTVGADAGRRDLARQGLAYAGWAFPGNQVEAAAREAFAKALGRPLTAADAPPEARLDRATRLLRDGDLAQAEVEFRAFVAARTAGAAVAEAWYRIGELRIGTDAKGSFEAFRRAAALGWDPPRSYYWLAFAARRAGRRADADAAVAALTRIAPDGPWKAQTPLAQGLRAEDDGRTADAALHYRRAAEAAPSSYEAAEARWRLGWIAMRGNRFADAEARFRAAGEAAPSRGEAARGWYWAAKAVEARGGDPNPLLQLVADRYPLTFYGQRSRARLKLPEPQLPPALPHRPPSSTPAPVYEELAWLGLDAEAVAAAEDVVAPWNPRLETYWYDPAGREFKRDLKIVRFLASAYARLGLIRPSVILAEHALGNGMRDEEMWKLAYPRAFWDAATAAASAARIDPLLLLALVREESRYDAAVISSAGAVGLAQLLPTTAQAMTNDRTLTAGRLKDPAINLMLGARYLRMQMDRFGGDARVALAAYNAGPGAARRWVGLDADPDFFIEKIGYAETRAYVQRVMGSYGVYRVVW